MTFERQTGTATRGATGSARDRTRSWLLAALYATLSCLSSCTPNYSGTYVSPEDGSLVVKKLDGRKYSATLNRSDGYGYVVVGELSGSAITGNAGMASFVIEFSGDGGKNVTLAGGRD